MSLLAFHAVCHFRDGRSYASRLYAEKGRRLLHVLRRLCKPHGCVLHLGHKALRVVDHFRSCIRKIRKLIPSACLNPYRQISLGHLAKPIRQSPDVPLNAEGDPKSHGKCDKKRNHNGNGSNEPDGKGLCRHGGKRHNGIDQTSGHFTGGIKQQAFLLLIPDLLHSR